MDNRGFVRRMFATFARGLRRAILGKSDHAYMKQFSGGDEYWDRVIAARLNRSSGRDVTRRSTGAKCSLKVAIPSKVALLSPPLAV